jgi:hypothetical protein
MIDDEHVSTSYIRSFDRRIIVEIKPGYFVRLRCARRLRLVQKLRSRKAAV